MVLPSFTVFPFIWLMTLYAPPGDWLQYFIILAFLACVILLALWLVFKVYPKAILSIDENEISLCFGGTGFLQPDDFSVNMKDIIYMTPNEITGNEYIYFKTKNPPRKFYVSARTYNIQEIVEFNTAIAEIRETIDAAKVEL